MLDSAELELDIEVFDVTSEVDDDEDMVAQTWTVAQVSLFCKKYLNRYC